MVGARIAADLVPDYPDQVIVAGRSAPRALAAAAALGHGTRGRVIDIERPASINVAPPSMARMTMAIERLDAPQALALPRIAALCLALMFVVVVASAFLRHHAELAAWSSELAFARQVPG